MWFRTSLTAASIFLVALSSAQTYEAPDLTCATTLGSGDVELQWVEPSVSCGPFMSYKIYGSSTGIGGPYSLIATIPVAGTTNYTHTGAGGTITVWYYYMESEFSCLGFSSLQSDTICNRDPIDPTLERVSVSPAGVNVNWQVSPSPQTAGYIIYRQAAGFVAIDTVWGNHNTAYLDLGANAQNQSEEYAMAAVDTCRNVGPLSLQPHRTIYLSGILDRCTGEIDLGWNEYLSWAAGIASYEVEYSINASPFINAASLPTGSNAYTFTETVNDGDLLCIQIRALSNDGVTFSTSNQYCQLLNIVETPDYQFIRQISAQANNDIDLSFLGDNAADIEMIRIHRDGTNLTTYLRGAPINPYTFNDATASNQQKFWEYEVSFIDSCGNAHRSDIGRSIFLNAQYISETENQLNWNHYMLSHASITQYELFRIIGGLETSIAILPAGQNNYLDDYGSLGLTGEQVCYRVEVSYDFDPPGLASETLQASSNVGCNEPPISVLMPNAFTPNGNNPLFRPHFNFNSLISDYDFRVYNRWGQELYKSKTVGDGWDGNFRGAKCDVGTYLYFLTYSKPDGSVEEVQGTLSLIR